MKILYFVQYFDLPDEPGGSRAYQFARAWTRAGHEVTVIAGNLNYKTLSVRKASREKLISEEEIDGIRVIRVWVYPNIRGSYKRRYLNFISYAFFALIAGLTRTGGIDLVYASSTPLPAVTPGYLIAFGKSIPFFFEVRDLWPESAVIAGALKRDSIITRFAAYLAKFLYERATKVVTLTRGIADGVCKEGIPEDNVLLVPNGVDDWMVDAAGTHTPSDPDKFRVVYCGAHGRWNGLEQIIEAADLLRDEEKIEFLFIGDGDERESLIAMAESKGLTSVKFKEALPKKDAFSHLQSCSVSVIVTWDHPFQRMVLANKLFDYMAAGHPVVVGADGEMAELMKEADAGIVVPPNKPDQLAEGIRSLAGMSVEERDRLGRNGRKYIIEHYQRANLALGLIESFEEAVAKR